MIDANRKALTAHIDRDLYGDPDKKAEEAVKAAEQDFNEMVHAAFNGSKEQGKRLYEYLDGYLKTPTWFPSEAENLAFYREGARSLARHLLDAYNAGGVPVDLKKK